MELYLFHKERFNDLYNCTFLSEEEWWKRGKPNPILGAATALVGLAFVVVYIPPLVVICHSKLLKFSAYKLMFYVGLSDFSCLLINSLVNGALTALGAVPCSSLQYTYIIGAVGVGTWASQSVSVVLLAFNRCIELWKLPLLTKAFEGKNTYIWIVGTLFYCAWFIWYSPGMLFNSIGYAWYFDPYYQLLDESTYDPSKYVNWRFIIHDLSIIVLLPALYIALIITIYLKGGKTSVGNKIQRLMTIQAFILCLFTIVTTCTYLYMQFFHVPVYVSIMVNFLWQFSNGAPAIMYLVMNRTIRQGVRNLLSRNNQVSISFSVPSRSAVVFNPRRFTSDNSRRLSSQLSVRKL